MNGAEANINLTFANSVWRHTSFSSSTTGVWTIYINGVKQNVSVTRTIPNIIYNLRYINKSVFSGDGNWNGQMDNFRIYNRVLSQNDVSSLYTTYNTVPPKTYTINFPKQTEVQLLLLDNLKYIETSPFTNNGQITINVGVPSTYNTLTTTANATPFNSGYVSNITGANIAYNAPVVIVRYKHTKIVVLQVQQTGYLNHTNANGWLLSQVSAGTTSVLTNDISSSGNAGTQFNNPTLGKLFITTVANSKPQIANNTMVNHLEVNGSTRLNGTLNTVETTGTASGANSGTIILDHENNGGASSITFRSKENRGSDYGYIQYQDSSSVGAGGESARLIIGTQNDADDHLILVPSGNVGIGEGNPFQKLTVAGNIHASGTITANYVNIPDIQANGTNIFALSSGTINVGNLNMGGTLSLSGAIWMGGNIWHHGNGRQIAFYESTGRNY